MALPVDRPNSKLTQCMGGDGVSLAFDETAITVRHLTIRVPVVFPVRTVE